MEGGGGRSRRRSVRFVLPVFKHTLDMWTVIKKLLVDCHVCIFAMHTTLSYIFPEIFNTHRPICRHYGVITILFTD